MERTTRQMDNASTDPEGLERTRSGESIRNRAEERVAAEERKLCEPLSLEAAQCLLHELRVRQLELEMQNEELRRTQAELEASRARYLDLYEQSPVGYLTLSEEGLILEANLTATTLLGVDRGRLTKQPISRFILPKDQDIYYLHRKGLLETSEPQTCELRMLRSDTAAFWTRLETVVVQSAEGTSVLRSALSDISEDKRAEAALRESEEKFRAMVDTLPLAIYQTTGTEQISEYVNPTMTQLFGYTLEDIPSIERWWLLACPDETYRREISEEWNRRVKRAIETQLPTEPMEVVVTCKDGSKKHISWGYITLGDKNYACGLDLTVQKQAEEATKAEQIFTRTMIESIPGTFYMIDAEGCYVRWNAYQRDEIVGKPEDQMVVAKAIGTIHPDDRELIGSKMENILRKGISEVVEGRVLLRGGPEYRWLLMTGRSVTIKGMPFLVGIGIDITERKQAEDAVREKEALFRSLVESLGEGVGIVDSQERFILANAAATAIFGVPAGGLLGRALKEFTSQDQFSEVQVRTMERQRGASGSYEVEITRPDGSRRTLIVTVTPRFDPQGGYWGALGVFRDITGHRQLEERLRQAQKMESVGQLAGGVAHDFNNILAATMMHISLLQSNPNLDGETQEGLKELIMHAKRGASLARQLLMFSRKSVLEVKTLDLNQLVDNVLKMLGRLIGEHIDLRFARHDGLPEVEADPGMIEQVLMNLSVNARDAMPKGGKLTISLEPIWVHAERITGKADASSGEYVLLSVADTGCGMDAGTQSRIFDPFFTTKEVGKGTGLGLATVYGIVTQHKGWIEVESAVGKGTTFRVFLPATATRTSQPSQTDTAVALEGNETILLVEDQETLRKAVARGLESLGYRVLTANNGQVAMRIWREQAGQIDLLFSDMIMPEGLSGLDLAETFQKDKPNLKVIISSGYHTDLGDLARPIARRVAYLGKPYEMGNLSKTIRECLDRK